MSFRQEIAAQKAMTRAEIDAYMDGYPNRDEFDYSCEPSTMGKRNPLPTWQIAVVRRGNDVNDMTKWCHAWVAHRAVETTA